ncbi:MAG: tryptophan-rich sensory protein [Flavobacteriaceae bacterium]|nr:tryptophan-rich sensory protein [Flavobacteriaceae bacterium]
MIVRVLIFLFIHFAALAVGSFFTSVGVPSDWYIVLNKAPWTPPGWVFGAAWSTIMVCFSLYMALLWPLAKSKSALLGLYVPQLVLNMGWNPSFFYYHQVVLGLVIIVALALLMTFFLLRYWSQLQYKSLLMLPYVLWLFVASSLNAYIVWYN